MIPEELINVMVNLTIVPGTTNETGGEIHLFPLEI